MYKRYLRFTEHNKKTRKGRDKMNTDTKTILNDVKEWSEKEKNNYKDGITGALIELIYNGQEYNLVTHLKNKADIHSFYKKHFTEINQIIKNETGFTVKEALCNKQDFELLINSIGGLDTDLSFQESYELEDNELAFIVWHCYESVAQDYLAQLSS